MDLLTLHPGIDASGVAAPPRHRAATRTCWPWVAPLAGCIAAASCLLPAARFGVWLAYEVIGMWWGLGTLAGLAASIGIVLAAATLAWRGVAGPQLA